MFRLADAMLYFIVRHTAQSRQRKKEERGTDKEIVDLKKKGGGDSHLEGLSNDLKCTTQRRQSSSRCLVHISPS